LFRERPSDIQQYLDELATVFRGLCQALAFLGSHFFSESRISVSALEACVQSARRKGQQISPLTLGLHELHGRSIAGDVSSDIPSLDARRLRRSLRCALCRRRERNAYCSCRVFELRICRYFKCASTHRKQHFLRDVPRKVTSGLPSDFAQHHDSPAFPYQVRDGTSSQPQKAIASMSPRNRRVPSRFITSCPKPPLASSQL
jgi:hypothetical protein